MSGKAGEVLSLVKVKVVIDWQFKEGETMEVYDTPPDNDFYFICHWGYRLIPKTHCQVIKGGD